MSVGIQIELSPGENQGAVCPECPPSSGPLRKSMAKVRKQHALIGKSVCKPRIPVITSEGVPLMPCRYRRALKWVKERKATIFRSKGLLCVRLRFEPSGKILQPIVVGIDPGSKKEGISVVGEHVDFLHIQLDARTEVKDKIENRRIMRRGRRSRNTPCRQPRWNRSSLRGNRVPPSTKARWDWKLRIVKWLTGLYPISTIVVEDIAAVTKEGKPRWNKSFSPLEVGKAWFYRELEKLCPVSLKKGYETKALRDQLGLKKTHAKLSEVFEAHCVDSFVLALSALGVHREPTSKRLLCVSPLDFRRRSLHLQVPSPGGGRRAHGGTRSAGLRKGTLIKSPKWGLTYLGGSSNGRVSLHDLETGKRLTKDDSLDRCQILGYNSVRSYWAILKHR